jgi:hypothetical protein
VLCDWLATYGDIPGAGEGSQEVVVAARERWKVGVEMLSFEWRDDESCRFEDRLRLRGRPHDDRRSLLGLGGVGFVCMGIKT